MKNMTAIVLAAAVCAAAAGCRRTDVREFSISIPGLGEADRGRVTEALCRYEGTLRDSIAFDFAAGEVKCRYDSMKVAKKNLEMELAAAGFVANGVTPESVGAKKAPGAAAK